MAKTDPAIIAAVPGTDTPVRSSRPATGAQWLLPVSLALVAGWWLWDLSFQWAARVEYRFGWLVGILGAFLTWERWPTRPTEDTPASGWLCLLLALPAGLFLLISELYRIGITRATSTSFVSSIACTLFLAAILLANRGPRTLRHFLFPILFLFIAVPLPGILWNPIVFSLQTTVAAINVEILRILGIPAFRQGHVIQIGKVFVGVDEACSGVRSLQSSIMAALFVGDLTLRRRSIKFLFLASGVLLAIIGNLLRSFYLSWTAYHQGTDRLKALHDTAGWSVLAFTCIGVCLLAIAVGALEKRLTRLSEATASDGPAQGDTSRENHE